MTPLTPCRLTAEDPAGSAPLASAWWLLHVPGAWGAKAVESTVPALAERMGPAARILLVRRPGRHPAEPGARIVQAWFARVGGEVLGVDAGIDEIARWDLADPPVERLMPDPDPPRLLVCTNARRDLCCGTVGRSLALAIADEPGVWECSHLGGHRFSPTALLLPEGWALAGLTADAARAALRDADLDPQMLRGRTDRAEPAQAAEIAVRRAEGLRGSDDVVDVEVLDLVADHATVAVTLADGTWRTAHVSLVDVPPRPVSCGADPTPAREWSQTDGHFGHPPSVCDRSRAM